MPPTRPSAVPLPAVPCAEECRCACGSLLARVVGDAVELKCRRCKRTVRVPLPPGPAAGAFRAVCVIPTGETG